MTGGDFLKNKPLEREYKTIGEMISLFCRERHDTKKGELCPACQELLTYTRTRLDKCPYNTESHSKGYRGGEEEATQAYGTIRRGADEDANKDSRMKTTWYQEGKPTCAKCPIHCYKPAMKERIRDVMRYAGPRMLRRHPVLAIRHLLNGLKARPRPPRG
jgi:hypothetical protein